MKVYQVYKKIGETPLEALEKFRKKAKISPAAKLTYAGRLDPMASGVLLILEGATQAQREKYMGLNKTYEVKILFGFETDSYDLLGIPHLPFRPRGSARGKNPLNKIVTMKRDTSLRRDGLEKILKNYLGLVKLSIPPYSSVPFKGKPLFEWARSGKLKTSDVTKRDMVIKNIKLSAESPKGHSGGSATMLAKRALGGKGMQRITSKALLKYIQTNIKKVKGDFRQQKILKAWDSLLSHPDRPSASEGVEGSLKLSDSSPLFGGLGMKKKYLISNILISCSSGTYIRSIAHDLGKKLGTGGVVFSLERIKVGKYKVSNKL